jgi:hypothetical protein
MYLCLRDPWDPTELSIYITKFDIRLARLSDIEFSITREMAPIYALGFTQAHSFARGRQGIAGTFQIKELYHRIPEVFDVQLPSSKLIGTSILDEGKDVDLDGIETNFKYTFVSASYVNYKE